MKERDEEAFCWCGCWQAIGIIRLPDGSRSVPYFVKNI